MAVFNVSEEIDNSDLVTLKDFKGIDDKATYIIRSHATGRVYASAPKSQDITVSVNLPTAGWDFFSAVPVSKAKARDDDVEVAVLGLISNLSGAAAVEGWFASAAGSGVQVTAKIKALGVLGMSLYIPLVPGLIHYVLMWANYIYSHRILRFRW